MGMYTELILGCELRVDTPEQVINALKYILGEIEEKPDDFPLPNGRCEWLLRGSSYYFAVSEAQYRMWQNPHSEEWIISARCNIKNYENEIETFLDWLKPYISYGSGLRKMYAIVIYEEQQEPTIYYLEEPLIESY